MFGIGLPEILVILVVALIVVGPSKLPELAKSLGKAFNEFKRMADEVKDTIQEEVTKEDIHETIQGQDTIPQTNNTDEGISKPNKHSV
ncbi:MAG: sec-independent translocase [Candidatus Methanofastidiosum methylothiophilum]|jgi:Tat protein translocase TatB subunit|uniref:Sec-independent protein translocase protein TatA n=1 Tax=Candidatus Methanofastidiosum methylothiophilum TaxID=1705564 RepID=A0A150JFX9_9EURY|nr:MAG: sec-independent translocase [Candidatus Methanofastidiosum methylthiophilus]MBV6506526.1 Sec-independent protein translocase protein TatB [Syntrophorhabdaceae bacterium]OQC48797.1 MAG: Sec-independent protein translocase protein TatAd [Deltaproteobacteria bacterium ADurb.Bin026]KYC55735.1 MAG: sec-independent translocase [Candidatus Methanofastidiosum methylthiophilus]KYC56120.1 MAG: sec-independent translocase [Candidatus Methanofastidiosum methylthiophilus]